jgi:hypothetical protein
MTACKVRQRPGYSAPEESRQSVRTCLWDECETPGTSIRAWVADLRRAIEAPAVPLDVSRTRDSARRHSSESLAVTPVNTSYS